MAIELVVKDYCGECCEFEADVIKPENRLIRVGDNDTKVIKTDTIVRCKYAKRCENIKRYLEQHTN